MGGRSLVERLNLKYPIIQAPMAGVTTPEFVAASVKAGVLGAIGAGYLSAEATREFIQEVKKRTDKSFSVNLFVPEKVEASEAQLSEADEALQPIREELGMPPQAASYVKSEFDEQVQVLIEEGVKICSFTFGLPVEGTVRLLKENDVFLIGTATTVEEAVLAEQAGMDAVVVQGGEAGGHRGSFSGELILIPLGELLSEVVAAVQIPVIAAGGIANKKQKELALSSGADAVQIGTALLASKESGANPFHKAAILRAEEGCTVITTTFSGKAARGIQNRFIEEMKGEEIAPYPYQNDLTKDIRKVAASQGKPEFMSLWAGESVHLSTDGTLEEIIHQFL